MKVTLENAIALLCENFDAWDGEEESVKEEHADLIERTEAFIDAYKETPLADRYDEADGDQKGEEIDDAGIADELDDGGITVPDGAQPLLNEILSGNFYVVSGKVWITTKGIVSRLEAANVDRGLIDIIATRLRDAAQRNVDLQTKKTALKLAVSDILEEVNSEIEQRQTSGNDEYWKGLQEKADKLREAIKAIS